MHKKRNDSKTKIDFSELRIGTYLLQIYDIHNHRVVWYKIGEDPEETFGHYYIYELQEIK